MFRRGRTQEETRKVATIAQMVTNQAVVLESMLPETDHQKRVEEFTGVHRNRLSNNMVERLIEASFRWVVDAEFVRRFHYHAGATGDTGKSPVHHYSGGKGSAYEVCYRGDVPGYVLDRVEVGRRCGLRYFTIHSMEPLPVEFILADPVLIGWEKNPNIWMRADGTIELTGRNGVVVAVWDGDKEDL